MDKPYGWVIPSMAQGMFYKEKPKGMATIPLYTHPAKTLTDEEIEEIAMQCSYMDGYGHSQLKEYDFARAILRKASEK